MLRHKPDLRWALFKMYGHHCVINGAVIMRLWMFATLKLSSPISHFENVISYAQGHRLLHFFNLKLLYTNDVSNSALLQSTPVLSFYITQSSRFLYESSQVKFIPLTEWTCVVQLVKRSNVSDGVGNVNYSVYSPCLVTLSLPEGIPMMYCTFFLQANVLIGRGKDGWQ